MDSRRVGIGIEALPERAVATRAAGHRHPNPTGTRDPSQYAGTTWSWGHPAVGYLAYTAWCAGRHRAVPTGGAALAVALGTLLPELVDKPLAWTVAVLPNGRSLGHSLVVAVQVLGAVLLVADRADRLVPGVALSIGYLSHPGADGLYPAVRGEFTALAYLGWPFLPPVGYDGPESFIGGLLEFQVSPTVVFEVLLAILAVWLWYRHGAPGGSVGRRALAGSYHAVRRRIRGNRE